MLPPQVVCAWVANYSFGKTTSARRALACQPGCICTHATSPDFSGTSRDAAASPHRWCDCRAIACRASSRPLRKAMSHEAACILSHIGLPTEFIWSIAVNQAMCFCHRVIGSPSPRHPGDGRVRRVDGRRPLASPRVTHPLVDSGYACCRVTGEGPA